MGRQTKFPLEMLVVPIIYTQEALYDVARRRLERRFGDIGYVSRELPFSYSTYYDREMGKDIRRVFLGFDRLVDPSGLWKVKQFTNRIEEQLAVDGRRKVNLDPGLLDLNRLVLATTKHAGHRIPLSRGIYAEITLHYRQGRFQPLPWTYPDYRSDEYQEILLELRKILHRKLNS